MSFGEPIANLQQDPKENIQQQSQLETLYNVFESLKPKELQQPTTELIDLDAPKNPVASNTNTNTESFDQEHFHQQACPVCANDNDDYKSLKKTIAITVLYFLIRTQHFQTLVKKFIDQPSLQQAITGIVFAALTLLIIRFFNF